MQHLTQKKLSILIKPVKQLHMSAWLKEYRLLTAQLWIINYIAHQGTSIGLATKEQIYSKEYQSGGTCNFRNGSFQQLDQLQSTPDFDSGTCETLHNLHLSPEKSEAFGPATCKISLCNNKHLLLPEVLHGTWPKKSQVINKIGSITCFY